MASRRASQAALITSAAFSRSQDLETRNRRYLITMAVRMVFLMLVFVVPGWWKLVMLLAGAVLPVAAVLLANNYVPPQQPTLSQEPTLVPALPAGQVISGTVEEQ